MIDRTRHVRRRNETGHRLGITSRMAGVIWVETLTTLAGSPANGHPLESGYARVIMDNQLTLAHILPSAAGHLVCHRQQRPTSAVCS
jgi:hypothetical protein